MPANNTDDIKVIPNDLMLMCVPSKFMAHLDNSIAANFPLIDKAVHEAACSFCFM
jgi:hypothetical protein